jgi:hypothetical protein
MFRGKLTWFHATARQGRMISVAKLASLPERLEIEQTLVRAETLSRLPNASLAAA